MLQPIWNSCSEKTCSFLFSQQTSFFWFFFLDFTHFNLKHTKNFSNSPILIGFFPTTFLHFREHNYQWNIVFPNHLIKLRECVWKRSLCCYEITRCMKFQWKCFLCELLIRLLKRLEIDSRCIDIIIVFTFTKFLQWNTMLRNWENIEISISGFVNQCRRTNSKMIRCWGWLNLNVENKLNEKQRNWENGEKNAKVRCANLKKSTREKSIEKEKKWPFDWNSIEFNSIKLIKSISFIKSLKISQKSIENKKWEMARNDHFQTFWEEWRKKKKKHPMYCLRLTLQCLQWN